MGVGANLATTHARGLADVAASGTADCTASLWGSRTFNLPSRFLDELPEEGVVVERLRPASWSGYGARDVTPRDDVPALATGDSVRHGTLGEGVVVRVEAGGVVTVRFADDGAERRLMLEYAPLEKIA